MKQVSLQSAYILHRRPYRETSCLLECLTKDYGKLTLIARSVRKARSPLAGLLQAFTPLTISWQGKGELPTLTYAEASRYLSPLRGDCLFAGFYLNELLSILLQKWDPHPTLFTLYDKTLESLTVSPLNEKYLRIFEIQLLHELGYGVLPNVNTVDTFSVAHDYRYIADDGLIKANALETGQNKSFLFPGEHLAKMVNNEWDDIDTLATAKRLMRLILTPMLGHRALYSRQLFAR